MVRCIKASSVARDGYSRRERVTPVAAMRLKTFHAATDQRYTAVLKVTQSRCPPGNTLVSWCSPHMEPINPHCPARAAPHAHRHCHCGVLRRTRPLRGGQVTAMAQVPVSTCSSRAADAYTGANLGMMISAVKSLDAVAAHIEGHNKDTRQAPGRQKHLEMLAFKDVLSSKSTFRTVPAGAGCARRWQDRRRLQFLCEWRGAAALSRQPGLGRFTQRESLCQADQCRHRGMESTMVSSA